MERLLGRWGRVVVLVLALGGLTAPAQAAPGDLELEVLSSRADLVSGGDALLRVSRADGGRLTGLRVQVGTRDVTDRLGADGTGLVDGLREGANVVTATGTGGRGARLTLTNHPVGGPLVAGPQVQPWICRAGAQDAQCNRPATVTFRYRDAATSTFQPYDPQSPPAASAIAQTTTDQGKTVPYIVRREEGVMDRGTYAIAVLAEAGSWNGKLLTAFGPNTAPHHTQPLPTDVMDDKALSRGFMVANNGLQINGENTNAVVASEALLMLKEHIVERYGRIRSTMAEGCSGGSYQVMDTAMYPGLVDGLQPSCTFPDIWTTLADVYDCGLLSRYFSGQSPAGLPLGRWMPAIDGHKEPSNCAAWYATFYPSVDPTRASACALPAEQVYHPQTNPAGTRCTIADYMVSIFGRRPEAAWTAPEKQIGRGFANRPWGNEGVQYGLRALTSGQITPEEFVHLNETIGGIDIDGKAQRARTRVDEATAATAYRGGAVMDATKIEDVPIIDLHAYNESGEIHTSGNSVKLRARLDRANGHHDNQIRWTWNNGVPITGVEPPKEIEVRSFLLMDRWLSRIEADDRDIPKARKVVLNKPRDAVDACWAGAPGPAVPGGESAGPSQIITDPGACATLYPDFSLTRPAAGAPATDDVIQCSLSPVDPADLLPAALSAAQLDRLRKAFPDGVCDYTKPAVGRQSSIPWTTYADGPGGRALGRAPRSEPIGGTGHSR